MEVTVLFFGVLHDLTGKRRESVRLQDGARLTDLWADYVRRFPRLEPMAASLLTSVNEEFTDRSQILSDGDEVAFLPPVSGGTGPNTEMDTGTEMDMDTGDVFLLTEEVIDTAELLRRVKAPADGAVVTFEGIVRDHTGERRTRYLEYEAYQPMALKKMREVSTEIHQRFEVDRVAIVHRLRRLEIGETSVAIVVAAGHRGPAFEACRYAIDRLKKIVPIWKKEFFADGAVWAEGEGQRRILVEAHNRDA